MLLVTLAVLGIIGKQQWDKYQQRRMLVDWIKQAQLAPKTTSIGTNPCPDSSLSKSQVLSLLVDGAINLEDRFERTYCLKLLAEQYPADATEALGTNCLA